MNENNPLSSLFAGIGNILNSQAASAYVYGLATRGVSSGRTPGAETLVNPLLQPAGSAGQPNTVPVVTPPGQIIPGVSNTATIIGLGLVAVLGGALVVKALK